MHVNSVVVILAVEDYLSLIGAVALFESAIAASSLVFSLALQHVIEVVIIAFVGSAAVIVLIVGELGGGSVPPRASIGRLVRILLE